MRGESFLICVLVAIVFGFAGYQIGNAIGEDDIAKDCRKLGKFHNYEKVYECRLVETTHE